MLEPVLHLLTDPNAWVSLLTLVVLEIVLGVDNLVFLSIVSGKLPPEQQPLARRIGLIGALGMRLGLLASLTWIMGLTDTVFTIPSDLGGLILDPAVSWRDVILIGGGLFLLWKSGTEIHEHVDIDDHDEKAAKPARFWPIVAQIMVLDIVFSLDSVITAVGMAQHLEIMMAAVLIAVLVMMMGAEPLSRFISRNKSVVMLALSFLFMIGMSLVAEGMGFHIPKVYLYLPMAFSIAVEVLNMAVRRADAKRTLLGQKRKVSA